MWLRRRVPQDRAIFKVQAWALIAVVSYRTLGYGIRDAAAGWGRCGKFSHGAPPEELRRDARLRHSQRCDPVCVVLMWVLRLTYLAMTTPHFVLELIAESRVVACVV